MVAVGVSVFEVNKREAKRITAALLILELYRRNSVPAKKKHNTTKFESKREKSQQVFFEKVETVDDTKKGSEKEKGTMRHGNQGDFNHLDFVDVLIGEIEHAAGGGDLLLPHRHWFTALFAVNET
jgi:hypothetical protein